MMENALLATRLPLTDRLWFKALALFFAVFFVTFFGGWFYDAVASYVDGRSAEENFIAQPQMATDAKIESDLAKVMSFDQTPARTDIRDPFMDRGSLSDIGNRTVASVTSPAVVSQQPAANSVPAKTVTDRRINPTAGYSRQDSMVPETVIDVSSLEATLARMRAREQSLSAGLDAGPESTIFAIEDLRPIGVVSGGNGEQEIMFYTKSLDRVMSFPIGTRFFDGQLIGLKPDGVEFGAYNANTIRFKSWGYGS
jgi:hypothetical protein